MHSTHESLPEQSFPAGLAISRAVMLLGEHVDGVEALSEF